MAEYLWDRVPAAIYPAHGKKFDYQDLEKNIKNLEKIKLRRLKY